MDVVEVEVAAHLVASKELAASETVGLAADRVAELALSGVRDVVELLVQAVALVWLSLWAFERRQEAADEVVDVGRLCIFGVVDFWILVVLGVGVEV